MSLAEVDGFDVILTADAGIKNQQNLKHRAISILILRAFNNRLTTHALMIENVQKALPEILPGEIVEVFHPEMEKRTEDRK